MEACRLKVFFEIIDKIDKIYEETSLKLIILGRNEMKM